MHELSLVQGLFSQVKELAFQHQARKVTRVVVKIGPFSGVVMDSFTFAFEVLKKDEELLHHAHLEIIRPGPRLCCSLCGREVDGEKEDLDFKGDIFPGQFFSKGKRCPHCGKGSLYPSGGDEILLMQIEME